MARCAEHTTPTPGCFRCKLVSIQFGNVTPPPERNIERGQDRDLPAYKRLRDNGLQPRTTRGAAELETRAHDPLEVRLGGLIEPGLLRRNRSRIEEGMNLAVDAGYTTADVASWKKEAAR